MTTSEYRSKALALLNDYLAGRGSRESVWQWAQEIIASKDWGRLPLDLQDAIHGMWLLHDEEGSWVPDSEALCRIREDLAWEQEYERQEPEPPASRRLRLTCGGCASMAAAAVFLCVLTAVLDEWNERRQEAKALKAGDTIIAALGRFHAEHGVYPQDLSELVPRYLESIPVTAWGHGDWHYRSAEDGAGFSLMVSDSPRVLRSYHYYSSEGRWWMDST